MIRVGMIGCGSAAAVHASRMSASGAFTIVGLEIEAASAAAGVTVMIRYQRRFFSAYRYMYDMIESGEIGEPRSIAVHCGQCWQQNNVGRWRLQPELSGGGMLMDTGSHMIDVLLWLARRPVESVFALVDNCGTPVDINTTATVRFADGMQGNLVVLGDYPGIWTETVMVAGTKAALHYEIDPLHPWWTGRVTYHRRDGIHQPLQLPEAPDEHMAWLAAIRDRASNLVPPSVGIAVSELCATAYRSAREGQTIHPSVHVE